MNTRISMNAGRQGSQRRREGGAALIVGMIMLLVLTLLAVSGMNTASTELIMSGNEQFQENAFQAAEAGIEQTMANVTFSTDFSQLNYATGVAVPGSTTDTYTTVVRPRPAQNEDQSAMWGNRLDSFRTFHFEIQSDGASARNAATTHVQGLFVLTAYDTATQGPLGGTDDLSEWVPPPVVPPESIPDPGDPAPTI